MKPEPVDKVPSSPRPPAEAKTPVAAGRYAESLYKAVLPAWRFIIRRFLLQALEFEVPYLAKLQVKLSPTNTLFSYS